MRTESMRKPKHFPFGQTWFDRGLVEVSLSFIGRKNLKIVGALCCFCRSQHGESISLRLLGARTTWVKTDDHLVTAVAKVLGLGVSLAAVAEYCDGLTFEG